jgi:hypothetical protein
MNEGTGTMSDTSEFMMMTSTRINKLNFSLSILMCVQQDATLHNLFYLETFLHVSGGTTTHHQERKKLYLQHLVFITPLLLPTWFLFQTASTAPLTL